jgi:hypothetical protein
MSVSKNYYPVVGILVFTFKAFPSSTSETAKLTEYFVDMVPQILLMVTKEEVSLKAVSVY